jgi:hypothetical protein
MIGAMIAASLLSRLVILEIYLLWKGRTLQQPPEDGHRDHVRRPIADQGEQREQ